MSAFVVSKKHIDRLVATIMHGPVNSDQTHHKYGGWNLPHYAPDSMQATDDRTQADVIGQALIDENLRSIHARYPDTVAKPQNTPGPRVRYWEEPYTFTPSIADRLPVVQALKALACYEYQSCEHEGWNGSQVQQFCERFRHSLINALPGYENAKWELT